MSLPEQIQKQVEAANRIIEEHYGAGEGGATPEPETRVDGDPVDAPKAEPVAQDEPSPRPAEDENSETYAQRWRSLQGINNSLQGQLNNANARLASLEQVISLMQSAPKPAADAEFTPQQFITDKDREELGNDLLDVASRAAKQENQALRAELAEARGMISQLSQQFQQLHGQVVPTVQRVAQNQYRSAEQEFFAAVGAAVPHYQQINADPRFHNWLLTPDPMTNISPQVYLEAAQKNLDAQRVVAIFRTFLGATGMQPTQEVSRKAPTDELQQQVAPGRTLASPAPSAKEARQWTRDQITKLYEDKTRGKFVGREAEFAALEKDIFAAQTQGRIAA